MKKTALTFGLFSLVMVATSFANPTTSNISKEEAGIIPPGGSDPNRPRKQDFHGTESTLEITNNLADFSTVNQSLGANRKLD
ncbi:hypothetical protein [Flavobacterium ustbae]|uniref:hypothetical protein n=1 Tax=Flavobacterium ustbae TaxID=2488790 RepID=UPI000F7B2A8F|nr:hypothetical protein [Flavobacterium ustbae]